MIGALFALYILGAGFWLVAYLSAALITLYQAVALDEEGVLHTYTITALDDLKDALAFTVWLFILMSRLKDRLFNHMQVKEDQ